MAKRLMEPKKRISESKRGDAVAEPTPEKKPERLPGREQQQAQASRTRPDEAEHDSAARC